MGDWADDVVDAGFAEGDLNWGLPYRKRGRRSNPTKCNTCGTYNVVWHKLRDGWVLHEVSKNGDIVPHACPSKFRFNKFRSPSFNG